MREERVGRERDRPSGGPDGGRDRPIVGRPAVELRLPFEGTWRVVRGPGDRVPSHGTHLFGQTFAFDFVAVDDRGRSAKRRSWRRFLATEPVEGFVGFGQRIVAPAAGRVELAHDGERDGVARRSIFAQVPYALTQRARLRRGTGAIAGNHVVLDLGSDTFVLLAHLRRGSLLVRTGDRVAAGDVVAACGNSGNSTEPHLHVQAMDAADAVVARGVPVAFRDYVVVGSTEASDASDGHTVVVERAVPRHRQVIRPLR